MANKYYLTINYGNGFITDADLEKVQLVGYPGGIYAIPGDNEYGQIWASRVGGVEKTQAEAQAIVDAEVLSAQTNWDSLNEDQKSSGSKYTRPPNVIVI